MNPSLVILNPSDPVILSKAKDLILLRVDSVKDLELAERFFGSASE